MPTHEALPRFWRDYQRLSRAQQVAFRLAGEKFVSDLRAGEIRKGLRVQGVEDAEGVYELTWAPDGRATFHYGDPVGPGEAHIVWRRIGSHDVLQNP